MVIIAKIKINSFIEEEPNSKIALLQWYVEQNKQIGPTTIPEMLALKMFELKLNQSQLAGILKIGTPKLSQIMNGKRSVDIQLLKAVHSKLHVDAHFLLEKS